MQNWVGLEIWRYIENSFTTEYDYHISRNIFAKYSSINNIL
jgi:hypothetical protein